MNKKGGKSMVFNKDGFEKTDNGCSVTKFSVELGVYGNIVRYDPEGSVKGALVFFPGQFLLALFYEEMLRWFALQGYIVFAIERSSEVSGINTCDSKKIFVFSAAIKEHLGVLEYIRSYLDNKKMATLPINLLGHSLGGEIALAFLEKCPGISKIVTVESPLALASGELREKQRKYCEWLGGQINNGETLITSTNSIIDIAKAAYLSPKSASVYNPEITNLDFFIFAMEHTGKIKGDTAYTPWYHYFDISDVTDVQRLLEIIVAGHCGNLSAPKAVASYSSIYDEYGMSSVLSGVTKIVIPSGTKGRAMFFWGGIGIEGGQRLEEAGFSTVILNGAHASIVHCRQSPKIWGMIKNFFEQR